MADKLVCVQKTHLNEYFENSDKITIFLLDEKLAESAWKRNIHFDSSSFFDLPDDCWIITSKVVQVGHWMEAYNEGNDATVGKLLRKAVDWNDDFYIYFFAKKKIVFRTQWHNFLQHWDDFIAIEDDCPIVTPECDLCKEAIVFRPIGDFLKIG